MGILIFLLIFLGSNSIQFNLAPVTFEPEPSEIVEENSDGFVVDSIVGTGPYKLVRMSNDIWWEYVLKGPNGEKKLSATAASMSPDEKYLAFSKMEDPIPDTDKGNYVFVSDLTQNAKEVMRIQIDYLEDPASSFAWSPDGRYLSFTSVGVADHVLYPKGAKFFVADLQQKTYKSYNEQLFYSCGNYCFTSNLVWSPDSKKILGIYRNFSENEWNNWTYSFVILDAATGKELKNITYPENTDEPIHFEFSTDMKSVRYYFQPNKWREVQL